MKRYLASSKWTIIALAVLAILISLRLSAQTAPYHTLKSATRTVPADMVMTEYLPANRETVKLKLVASERDGRPMKIYCLDEDSTGAAVDIERGKARVLCDGGDLASGSEFVLPPGHYRLCFELTTEGLKKNSQPFHVTYSLYEHR